MWWSTSWRWSRWFKIGCQEKFRGRQTPILWVIQSERNEFQIRNQSKTPPLKWSGVSFWPVQGINLLVESRSSESKGPRFIWNQKWPLLFILQVVTNNAKTRLVGLRWTLVNSISRRNHHAKLVGIVVVGVDASEENHNCSKTWKTSTKWSYEPGLKHQSGLINAKSNWSDKKIYGVKTLNTHYLCQFDPRIFETNPGSITTQNEKVKTIVQREYT